MLLGIHREAPNPRISRTLSFRKGFPVVQDAKTSGTAKEAIEFLKSQNHVLSKEKLIELTYGPKKAVTEKFIPHWVAMANKMLSFDGFIKEIVHDWGSEPHRIRYVKLQYFLENDTIRVLEPEILNSTLCQGTLLKRDHYLHPNRKRNYNWKDLNIGNDISIYGREIHLIDCDAWTKQYLTDAGLVLGNPEPKPVDPHSAMKENTFRRKERRLIDGTGDAPSVANFYQNDGKVLTFYGIWKNDPAKPPAVRRLVLNYFLVDNSLQVVHNPPPNSGWTTLMSAKADIAKGEVSSNIIIKRQKVLLDRRKEVEKIPFYFEPKDIDDITWIQPEHLKTGEDIIILGKTFYFGKTDDFTKHYYKEHFGIDLPQIEIVEKPKRPYVKIVPPHGLGKPEETLQDCYVFERYPLGRFYPSQVGKSKEMEDTVLRFAARMDTPRETEQIRRFVVSFFMDDETVRIYEESVPNSGFGSGIFLQRSRLKKKTGQSSLKDAFYEPKDFYVGAKIVANGCTFVLTDADVRFYTFVENHPEIYTDINAEDQKRLAHMLKGKQELTEDQKMHLLKDLRDAVLSNYGCSVYPTEAIPDIGFGLSPPDLVIDKLYSGNLPISQELLKRLVDAFTFEGRTELDEIRTFLLVALGHDRDHGK